MDPLNRMLAAARANGMSLRVVDNTYTFLPPEGVERKKRVVQRAIHIGKTKHIKTFAELKELLLKKFETVQAAQKALKTDMNFFYKKSPISAQKATIIETWLKVKLGDSLVSTKGRWARDKDEPEGELEVGV